MPTNGRLAPFDGNHWRLMLTSAVLQVGYRFVFGTEVSAVCLFNSTESML